jgi:proline dehydrogenase
MVDAEETWMQDAADHLCEEMMEKYNQENLLFGIPSRCTEPEDWNIWKKTFREQEKGYFIGYKIVRGAYMEKERARAAEKGYPDPIQPTKKLQIKIIMQELIS